MTKNDYETKTHAIITNIRSGQISQSEGALLLVDLHFGLILKLLAGYRLERDEVRSIGYLAILRAIPYWDATRGTFTSVLQWAVRKEMNNLLRGCPPNDIAIVSLQAPISDSETLIMQDTIPCETDFEERSIESVTKIELSAAVKRILLRMPSEQRLAVEEHFFNGRMIQDRSSYQKALRTLRQPHNRAILESFLESRNLFLGTGINNFRRTHSGQPETIVIMLDEQRNKNGDY